MRPNTRNSNSSGRESSPHKPSTPRRPKKSKPIKKTFLPGYGFVNSSTLNDIRRLQTTVHNIIPRLSFQRVVREVLQAMCHGANYRVQAQTLLALQEAAEGFIVHMMEDAYLVTLNAKRKTLLPRDISTCMRIRGESHYLT